MEPDYTEEIARVLRVAADALERGERAVCEFICVGIDDVEWCDTAGQARRVALGQIEPDDGEYHPDVERVMWGVVVPVEIATVEASDCWPDGTPAADHGYDEHWDVGLEDAWPAGEPDMSDREARLTAAVATYLLAVENETGQALALSALRRAFVEG